MQIGRYECLTKVLELSIVTFFGSFVCIQCYQKDVNNGMIGNIRERATMRIFSPFHIYPSQNKYLRRETEAKWVMYPQTATALCS